MSSVDILTQINEVVSNETGEVQYSGKDILKEIDEVLEESCSAYTDDVEDFKKWFYIYDINENEDDDTADATEREVREKMISYEVSELQEFVEEALDNSDFSDKARRYFHPVNFTQDLMDLDGYRIFKFTKSNYPVKKFKAFVEINCMDEKQIWMDEMSCCTCDTYYIIKEQD